MPCTTGDEALYRHDTLVASAANTKALNTRRAILSTASCSSADSVLGVRYKIVLKTKKCKGPTPKWGAAGSTGSFGRCLRVSGAPKDPMRSLRAAWEPSRDPSKDPSKDPAGAFTVLLTRRRRSAACCCSTRSHMCCPDGRRQRSPCRFCLKARVQAGGWQTVRCTRTRATLPALLVLRAPRCYTVARRHPLFKRCIGRRRGLRQRG